MIALPMSYLQHQDPNNTILFAKSIFVAVPVSLTFFLPFLLSDRLQLSFWQAYVGGCACLAVGFVIHRAIARLL